MSHLISKITCSNNLYLAFYKAKKHKQYKLEVLEFAKNLDTNIQKLQYEITKGQVNVGNYHYFTIYDPKQRLICSSAFNERVLHHALMNICHPYFEKHLIYNTYATRPKKGTFKAIDKARYFTKNYAYYLKLDIRKYFDSINHAVLNGMLRRMFKDEQLLLIFQSIISSYSVTDNCGLPIGNLTSQYFANHYLSGFDHFVKEVLRINAYVRYMDDMIIWENDLEKLHCIKSEVESYLQINLKLSLKTKYLNKTEHGIGFLGFRLFPNKVLLSRRSKKRFYLKIRKLASSYLLNEITEAEFALPATALFSFIQKAYTKQFRRKILKEIQLAEIEKNA